MADGNPDSAFFGLDDSLNEIRVLAESVLRGDRDVAAASRRYDSFYEKVEQVIIGLLQYRNILVDPQRTSTNDHRFHENTLRKLAEKSNPFYHMLGSGYVYSSLHHAKNFRNKYRNENLDESDLGRMLGIPDISERTRIIARALRIVWDKEEAMIKDRSATSKAGQLLKEHGVADKVRYQKCERYWLPRMESKEKQIRDVLDILPTPTILPWLNLQKYQSWRCSNVSKNKSQTGFVGMMRSPNVILMDTLRDLQTVFRRSPKDGQAQSKLLIHFVQPRLSQRQDPYNCADNLEKITGILTQVMVNLIKKIIGESMELQASNKKLKLANNRQEGLLSIWKAEAQDRLERLVKQEQENNEIKKRLKVAEEDASTPCGDMTKGFARSLVASMNSFGTGQANLQKQVNELRAELVAKMTQQKHVEEPRAEIAARAAKQEEVEELKAANAALQGQVDELRTESTITSSLQRQIDDLHIKLVEERTSREAAEARERATAENLNQLRNQLASLANGGSGVYQPYRWAAPSSRNTYTDMWSSLAKFTESHSQGEKDRLS